MQPASGQQRSLVDNLRRVASLSDNEAARRAMSNLNRAAPPLRAGDKSPTAAEGPESKLYRVVVDGDDGGPLLRAVASRVHDAFKARTNSMRARVHDQTSSGPLSRRHGVTFRDGIASHPEVQIELPSYNNFIDEAQRVHLTIENSQCSEACRQRLDFLQEKSRMLMLLNTDAESHAGHSRPGGVYAIAAKVDNSVRLSRGLAGHEALDLICDMFEKVPHDPVCKAEDGANLSLSDLVADAGVRHPGDFTVDGLGWHPSRDNAQRFDLLNEVEGRQRDRLTKLDQFRIRIADAAFRPSGGIYPMIAKRLISKLESRGKYVQAAEYRVPVYGLQRDDLLSVAKVFKSNNVGPSSRAMWLLNLRFFDAVTLYKRHRAEFRRRSEAEVARTATRGRGDKTAAVVAEAPVMMVSDYLANIFGPLFDATLKPEESGALSWFLANVGGLHLESLNDKAGRAVLPPPGIGLPQHVPLDDPRITDAYIDYYIWANLQVLNALRTRNRLNKLQLRRGIGGPVGVGPIVSGYLLADMLTNAAVLDEFPVAQYLVGLHRIGITVSPIHNNLFRGIQYDASPLGLMLHRSLLVAVATESPLHTHEDVNPLIEEMSMAQKMLSLTGMDVAELARNSVVISSFPQQTKTDWLGADGQSHLGPASSFRSAFREEVWREEAGVLLTIVDEGETVGRRGERGALWNKLSSVADEEYFSVRDKRVRFPRTVIAAPKSKPDRNAQSAAKQIARALELRKKYIWRPERGHHQNQRSFEEALTQWKTHHNYTLANKDSVFIAYKKDEVHSWPSYLPTLEEFHEHLLELKSICDNVDVKTLAYQRLEVLDYKFRLHLALNKDNEAGEGGNGMRTRDFYHSSKVDTHIHMAAGMTGRNLRRFIVDKLQNNGDDIVSRDDKSGVVMTYNGVAKKLGVTERLTVDHLNVQADHTLFQRFDNFNNKYNPISQPVLRTMLLKTDNYMNGRYFAEMINDTFAEYAKDKYTFAENRLSIYGINTGEWAKLADWFDTHGMGSKHNKWIIQVPRVYKAFRENNTFASFGQYIENIFQPLWLVSLEPHAYPKLHNFLEHVSGFDSVDNEATIDLPFSTAPPKQWTAVQNPPYNYYMYHLWANIRSLNQFRHEQGLSTFSLRPHCGESGSDEHLIGAFLTADAINHGINLKNDPSIEYIYYLARVGLAVSPLSNNALFLYFLRNPFNGFFRRGLNVSLSTDDPLMFHQTREPLIEEYSIAAKVWGLSMNDLCEIARNSVLQSGYGAAWKAEKLGPRWFYSSSQGNDPNLSHMSNIRQAYRFEAYHAECALLDMLSNSKIHRIMTTTHEENKMSEEEPVAKQTVLVSTLNEGMERLQRDIKDRKEGITFATAEMDTVTRQHRALVEQVSELGGKIAALEAEIAEMDRPPPKAEITYTARHAQNVSNRGARPADGQPQVFDVEPNGPAMSPQERWLSFLRPEPPTTPPPREAHSAGGARGTTSRTARFAHEAEVLPPPPPRSRW